MIENTVRMLLVMIYNLCILFGAVYLVTEYDWSEWTMLLAVLLLWTISWAHKGMNEDAKSE